MPYTFYYTLGACVGGHQSEPLSFILDYIVTTSPINQKNNLFLGTAKGCRCAVFSKVSRKAYEDLRSLGESLITIST